jgi:hypothetical protein
MFESSFGVFGRKEMTKGKLVDTENIEAKGGILICL